MAQVQSAARNDRMGSGGSVASIRLVKSTLFAVLVRSGLDQCDRPTRCPPSKVTVENGRSVCSSIEPTTAVALSLDRLWAHSWISLHEFVIR